MAQYVVIRRTLERADLLDPGDKPRFDTFWGMNLPSGLAILLGCIVLIVPGVYLAARWMAAGPILLTEEATIGEALGRSWAMIRGSMGLSVGILLVVFLPACLPACLLGAGIGALLVPRQPLSSAIRYTGMFAAFMISWYAAVAIYILLAPPQHTEFAEIFA